MTFCHLQVDDPLLLYLVHMCQCGLTLYTGRTSVFLCATSLQNLEVSQDFCSPLNVPLKRSFLTPYSMVWDCKVSRAGQMLFYWSKLLYPYYSVLLFFPFIFFLSKGWYCGAGDFGLIGCISVSLSLALPSFSNNNNILIYCHH